MIQLSWADIEQKVLIWKFGRRWSHIDLLTACQKTQQMMKSVNHHVHLLMDLSASRFYPTNLIYLAHTGIRMRPDNIGHIVVVSESLLWSRLYHHLIQVYPADSLSIDFVNSQDKAMHILEPYMSNDKWANT